MGLPCILTPSTVDKYITDKAIGLEIQRLIIVAIARGGEEDPGLGDGLSYPGKEQEQKQEGRP